MHFRGVGDFRSNQQDAINRIKLPTIAHFIGIYLGIDSSINRVFPFYWYMLGDRPFYQPVFSLLLVSTGR